MPPSYSLVGNELDHLEIGSAATEAKLDDRAHRAGAPGIGSPPFCETRVGGQQFINFGSAALDANAVLYFRHGRSLNVLVTLGIRKIVSRLEMLTISDAINALTKIFLSRNYFSGENELSKL